MKSMSKLVIAGILLWGSIWIGVSHAGNRGLDLIRLQGTIDRYLPQQRVLVMRDASLLIREDVVVTRRGKRVELDDIKSGDSAIIRGFPPQNVFDRYKLEVKQIELR